MIKNNPPIKIDTKLIKKNFELLKIPEYIVPQTQKLKPQPHTAKLHRSSKSNKKLVELVMVEAAAF